MATVAMMAIAALPLLTPLNHGAHATVALAAPSCVNNQAPVGSQAMGTSAPGPLTFPTGCYPNGVTVLANRCQGTLVGVYGSSALKTYINNVANDYCNFQLNGGTAPSAAVDVEYLGGGDSCPGDQWAANNSDSNELGLSDVFAPSCAVEGIAVPSTFRDNNVAVNVVEAVTYCPGATQPQGLALHPVTSPTSCTGSGSGAAGSATFCAPNTLSLPQASRIFQGGVSNFNQEGGCNNATSEVQQRQSGSGTRVTWCFNVLGAGTDACSNTAEQVPATTTTDMLNDVCGNPNGTGAGPADAGGPAIGYATRSAVVVDPRNSPATVLGGCGLVGIGNETGYNQDCNPVSPSGANATTNPVDGAAICVGDLQVARGSYSIWGYEHLVVNSNTANNAAARAFVTWATTTANEDQTQVWQNGFMRGCQMLNKRTLDGGPYAGATPTC